MPTRDSDPVPSLSVVVATTHPWPELEACLVRLRPQVKACGGELIIADGSGRGVPAGLTDIEVIVDPGASVFALRAAGARLARGAIIALTEDHCLVAEDWCERIIEAHRQHPEAQLVAGSVMNASTNSLFDWANFLMTFGPFTRPFLGDVGSRVPPPANVSLKRFEGVDALGVGELEIALPDDLRSRGLIIYDDSIQLQHVQPQGMRLTIANHYHNGRATAGLAMIHRTGRERRSHVGILLKALPRMVREVFSSAMRRRRSLPLRALFSLPATVVLAIAHTTGAAIGALRGPGRSPERLS